MMTTLIEGDCKDKLSEIDSESVDLIFTSPPYAKQRDYVGAFSEDYISWISPMVIEMKRVMKHSGNFVLNIKEHCKDGQRDLYVFKTS